MQKKQFIVALDQGTSASRAVAVAPDGSIYAQKKISFCPTRTAEGFSEYDAQSLADSQLGVLNALLDEIGPQNVLSLAVTSQRSTVVLWDGRTGHPLAPVLTWEDGRAFAEANRAPISQEEVHTLTGLYKTPYFSAPKIAWCLRHIPQVRLALETGNLLAAPVASFLIWKMTKGKIFATDFTLAQRMLLLDIRTRNWSEKLCRAFAVDSSILPYVYPSVADYGFYEYNGISIPITVCTGDQQASVAFTQLSVGESLINYGTGAFLMYNAGPKESVFLPGLLTSLSVSRPDGSCDFLLEGPVNAAGSVFQWLNAQGISFVPQEIDRLCKESKNPIWFFPALGGLGAPYWDFALSPVAAGLSVLTRKEDWVAGAVRSVGFLLADIAAYLRVNGFSVSSPVRVSGGLSKIKELVQHQADLFQTEILLLRETESTVLGAARLAAEKAGWNVASWKPVVAEKVFPSVSEVEAAALYNRWKMFTVWCKEYPN